MTNPTSKQAPKVIPTEKPPLILVHGFRGSPIGLDSIAKILREHGYQVYIPAIPPFGGAVKLDAYTPQQYADFLANYIKTHHLESPVLIGHSMGSIVVAAMVDKYPELVNNKTILLSPIATRTAAPFRLVAPLSAVLPRRIIDYITTKYLFVPHDKALLRQTLVVTHACSNDNPPLKSEVLKSATFSTKYCVSDFHSTQNTLLLAGEKDRLIKKRHTIATAQKMHASVDFLPGCGHLHNYEQPQATAERIIKFLEHNK